MAVTAFSQFQNAFNFQVSGIQGTDQTILQFAPGSSATFETGMDLEKVFPSDQTMPTIFTADEDGIIYTFNSMNVAAMEDTIIPVYVNNPIAGAYTLTLNNLSVIDTSYSAKVVFPSTNDTIEYVSGMQLNMNLNMQVSIDLNTPLFYFVIGREYDLTPTSMNLIAATCKNTNDGKIELDILEDNVAIELLDMNGISVFSGFLNTGLNTVDMLEAGTYSLDLKKGMSSYFKELSVQSQDTSSVALDFISIDSLSLAVEIQVNTSMSNSLELNLGDGTVSNDPYVYHYYSAADTYVVELDVWNSNCSYSVNETIDFSEFLSTEDSKKEQDLRVHYSKKEGLVIFGNANPLKKVEVYDLQGKLVKSVLSPGSRIEGVDVQEIIVILTRSTGAIESRKLILQ